MIKNKKGKNILIQDVSKATKDFSNLIPFLLFYITCMIVILSTKYQSVVSVQPRFLQNTSRENQTKKLMQGKREAEKQTDRLTFTRDLCEQLKGSLGQKGINILKPSLHQRLTNCLYNIQMKTWMGHEDWKG